LLNANKDQQDLSIMDSQYNAWFHFNDHLVTFQDEKQVISEKSYLLFFRKKEISSHTLVHMTHKELME
jgi:DNA repair ATPase RecN